VQDLMQQVHLKTMQVKNGAVVASNSERSFAGAYGLILVLYASVLIYGINIARFAMKLAHASNGSHQGTTHANVDLMRTAIVQTLGEEALRYVTRN